MAELLDTQGQPLPWPDAPDLLWDIDGYPMALRKDLARSPAQALREVMERGHEDLVLDLAGVWDEDGEELGVDFLELLRVVRDIEPGWMSPARTEEEAEGEWGWDGWYWRDEGDEAVVEYWNLGLN